jgi:pilus assembly protein CpaC
MVLREDGAAQVQASRVRTIAKPGGTALVAALAMITVTAFLHCAGAAEFESNRTWEFEGESARHLTITLYKSRTIRMYKPFSTAVVGAPDIADVLPMSDHSLYIQGKKVGTTNLSVFDQSNHVVSVLDLEVVVDTENLREKIVSSTGSRHIRVSSSNGQIVLSGVANDAIAADRAVSVAKGFAPNGVVNAMSIAQPQQVLLKVRFLEASRDAGRQLGVNWFQGNPTGTRGVNTGTGAPFVGSPAQNAAGIPLIQTAGTLVGTANQPFGVVLARLVNGGQTIDVLVTALETQGLIRRLAEPNLMALSGDTARFLAGGEFPVPIAATSANGLVTPTIEYKPFGVRLVFTPTVLANGVINLRIQPEVSELDFANAVTISGTTVPSLVKRDALTTVELRDGQSFAIAGLLQANDLRNRSQLPWIGSVPVLGMLFSSMGYQKHETDLVIIVTPQLVQPAVPGQRLATPLDQRLPSNDVDFFLLGQSEVRKEYSDFVNNGGGLQGPYGHMIRTEPDPNAVPSRR